MIDLSTMTLEDLALLKLQIEEIENTQTRQYEVTFRIKFKANRTDDLTDERTFMEHLTEDITSYWALAAPEGVTDVTVVELR
jgi:hypothetical protein